MNAAAFWERTLSGGGGPWSLPMRAGLRLLEIPYAAAVSARNRRYDRRGPAVVLDAPVISVGNITVGGTGKTPLVIELVGRLDRLGRTPAVVSRGYGATEGEPNDEELVIRRRCPTTVCIADADRARGAQKAVERFGADAIVLDDGFQHRRLGRVLDLVAIDAMCPFGYGHVLPRGLLREPVRGLRRADAMIVTRADQIAPADRSRLARTLEKLAPDVPMAWCRHHVTGVERLDGAPWDGSLAGKRAVLFAGIGRPAAFRATACSLGIDVAESIWFRDHHRYSRSDALHLEERRVRSRASLLLTTEKDAAKLAGFENLDVERLAVVRVSIDFEGEGSKMLDELLSKALGFAEQPPAASVPRNAGAATGATAP